MAITFDGANKQIVLDAVTTEYTAIEIYSRWKDWVQGGQGNWLEAFAAFGGDPLGGGQISPIYVFLRNDLGWRIKRPESDIDVLINGNLVGTDSGLAILTGPNGAFSPTVTINRSQTSTFSAQDLWNVLAADFSGDATMGAILGLILKLARNKAITNRTNGKFVVYDDDNTSILVQGNIFENADGTQAYRGQGIERREKLQ
jgi:hypothetical protein